MTLGGILFDKDGTLFDFGATWNAWAVGLIQHLSEGDLRTARRIAEVTDFDLDAGVFRPTSPIIAGTGREAAECVSRALPDAHIDALEAVMNDHAARAPQVPPTDLVPLLNDLAGRGLNLGVMTNDSEYAARAHLTAANVLDRFDWIAGFDSGHGAKPAPTPLLAFASQMDLDPARVAMVGDSTHDLIAGRAAGMVAIAVLTGLADHDTLAPYAHAVLPHIGHLPDWLNASG
ncbi:HAD family hydrolase [Pseudooceanicola sp. MF1-13]|uniref:HAD family hydrolase n=1 Tax=Pseudooceanicola sp. MF1-13 TaxID=3379095 RepID=UPI003892539A